MSIGSEQKHIRQHPANNEGEGKEKGGTTMKTYENPELEIVRFTTEDVITTSGDNGNIDLPPLPAD